MKTDNIPALVTLSAGAIYCIIGLSNDLTAFTFCKELLIVLIIFFFVGSVIKMILDKNFKDFGDDEEADDTNEADASDSENDTNNETETEHINTEDSKTDESGDA